MQLDDVVAALRRRWVVVVAGLLATAAACGLVVVKVPPQLELGATVLLVPGETTIVQGGNPLLYLGGLVQARDVLVRSLSADAFHEEVAAEVGGEVLFAADPTTSGPVVTVAASGPAESQVRSIRDGALALVPRELQRLQEELDVPPEARVTALVLASDEQATANHRSQVRLAGALVAVGVTGTLLLAALVDRLLLSRPRRGAGRGEDPPTRRAWA